MIIRLSDSQLPDGYVRAISLNIPEGIDFSFTESKESVHLCLKDDKHNKIVERTFYYNYDQSEIMNKMKMYQVIQNMIKEITQ
ncbi:hypothetical protein ABEV41_00645 [Geobacillus thermodenitrificans]|uniref:hypothetical protein n=1 Tax=Geobacillus thermodenitrificans TaxID=33940 RepID=UPI003D1A2DEE